MARNIDDEKSLPGSHEPSSSDASGSDKLFWMGIGASAGGLEALNMFVRNLPENANMICIIAQHLSPQHRSMLPELIKRETLLSVSEMENGTKPKANFIYITPPGKDVIVSKKTLYLKEPSMETAHPKPSVDRFFTSLSEEIAIGIVLSGTGSDGAHGIKAIRAAGDITIAQDENSAKYYGMPGSAVGTGGVDLILPPDEIGQKLSLIIESPRTFEAFKTMDAHRTVIEELIFRVSQVSGVSFQDYKPNTIHRRIERRMKARGYKTVEDYAKFACDNDEAIDLLFKDLLISVTPFFRDHTAFNTLNGVIREIILGKEKDEIIRIWVPGCCTGEEVYSIGIMLAQAIGGIEALSSQKFQIFATDIDETALEVACKGVYPEAIFG